MNSIAGVAPGPRNYITIGVNDDYIENDVHSAKGVMGCAFVLAFQVLSLPLRDLSLEIPKELKSHIKMGQHFTVTDVPEDKSQYVMEVFNDEKDLFCIYDPKTNEVHVYKGILTD